MFKDRYDAAHQLVPKLSEYKNNPDAIIIAIPRGGLELGSVLAHELHLPLDVIFTKKIGYPGNPEYAIGAVGLQGVFIDPKFADIPIIQPYIEQQTIKIRELLQKRSQQYRGNKPPLNLSHKIVIVVDDGIATGNTLLATLALIKKENPQKIIVALPVAPVDSLNRVRQAADEVVCVLVPEIFLSVGQFYQQFNQVEDEEAIRLLHEAQS